MSENSRENRQLQGIQSLESEAIPTAENLALLQDNILTRLNEDCLVQIFEYFSLAELAEVADVCSAFESNASSVFRRNFARLDFSDLLDESECDSSVMWDSDESFDLEKSEPTHIERLPMNLVAKLFRHFGMCMRTIDLSGEYDDDQIDEIFQLMATHCAHDDAELSKLIMNDISISTNVAPRLQRVFDRLTSLDITDGPFRIGSELTELILENVTLDRFVNQKLDKLRSLSLIGVKEKCRGSFTSLLNSSPHIKRLIVASKGLPSTPQLSATTGSLDELEELQIDALSEPTDARDARQYHRLKLFQLDCMWYSKKFLTNFIPQNLSIEELHLSKLTISIEAATHLAKLSNVKRMSFVEGGWEGHKQNSAQLSNVVKGMPNLEKIFLCDFGCVTIDDVKEIVANASKLNEIRLQFHENETLVIRTKDFNEINGLIAQRAEGTKLHLIIEGNYGSKQKVVDPVICKNSTWLEVNVTHFIPNHCEPVNIIDYYGFSDDTVSSDGTVSSEDDDGFR